MSDMNSVIWRRLGRWSLALAVCIFSLLPAIVFLQISADLDKRLIRFVDALGFHSPTGICLSFARLVTIFFALSLWLLPSAFAIGFALRAPFKSRFQSGLTLCLLFTSAYLWWMNAPGAIAASKIVAVTVPAILVSGIVFSRMRVRATNFKSLAIVLGAFLLTVPTWIAIFLAPPEPVEAQKIWSVALQKSFWQGMNTGSAYNARRQVIFAGDRLLVSFDAGSAPYEGNQPMSNYHLLSLDVQTGAVLNSKEFLGKWGHMPLLYAANDGRAILQHESLKSLNPDLTDAGAHFTPDRGRVTQMSPDGSTMVWETAPGSTLLDSHTLTALAQHLDESVPTSVSKRAVLTDNVYWYGDFPNDHAFVTLTDETGKHLLFHGDCGGRPEFLSSDKVLIAGCGRIRIIDIHGKLLRETQMAEGVPTFAGVSQDGRRFAIEFSEVRGDPPSPLYDHFVMYDTETAKPIAMVRIADLPEYNSWSAFSPDGTLFVAGSPNNLSLYRIP
jgi:hypothetical protein